VFAFVRGLDSRTRNEYATAALRAMSCTYLQICEHGINHFGDSRLQVRPRDKRLKTLDDDRNRSIDKLVCKIIIVMMGRGE
jgi:hypothetical protein